MNPVYNPYNPGAGALPPELAGREEILRNVQVSFERLKLGRPAKSMVLLGLRGVGKTVLLDTIRNKAEELGLRSMRIEAPEMKSLPALLAPELRKVLLGISVHEQARSLAQRALKGLAGFARALKVKYNDIEVGFDQEPEPGLADNGDLDQDLQDLFEAVGRAAQQAETAIVICIDELQYVQEKELAALITALHRCSQLQVPILMIAAGLPQLRGLMGEAKSYSERLFDYPFIGALKPEDSQKAIEEPARKEQVLYEQDAVSFILEKTEGYPYFLQEWGKQAWNVAKASPITLADVKDATDLVMANLDEGFFKVRFDRMTPSEKAYLRAMAELGKGPSRSGDIARLLNREVTSLAPTRASLIKKGMIWSPNHGDTAFTVPLFDAFMRRMMPEWKA
ncbi:MAG: ATP-binding protein [Bacteroidetes bacterium]|nr:ATP-binding protein [Bacteroidota bacterium]